MERLPSLPFSRLPNAPASITETIDDHIAPPPANIADSTDEILDHGKAEEFKTAPLAMVNIDSLAIAAVHKLQNNTKPTPASICPTPTLATPPRKIRPGPKKWWNEPSPLWAGGKHYY